MSTFEQHDQYYNVYKDNVNKSKMFATSVSELLEAIGYLFHEFRIAQSDRETNFNLSLLRYEVNHISRKLHFRNILWKTIESDEDLSYAAFYEQCGPVTGSSNALTITRGYGEFMTTMNPALITMNTPIEYIMFHICTSIAFDYIVDNREEKPDVVENLIDYLAHQQVSSHIHPFFGENNHINIRKLIQVYWKQIASVYSILSPQQLNDAWSRTCWLVKNSIILCGISDIRSDINQALYQLTNSEGHYMFEPGNRWRDRSLHGLHITPRYGIDAVIENGTNSYSYDTRFEYAGSPYVGAWQDKFERDYLIPVFYADMDFVKTPLRSYKKVFDLFRIDYYEISSNSPNRMTKKTTQQNQLISMELGWWGLAVSTKSLAIRHLQWFKTTTELNLTHEIIAELDRVLTKNIYPRMYDGDDNVVRRLSYMYREIQALRK